jgi:formate dehydrogenase iron-sulfur subunit
MTPNPCIFTDVTKCIGCEECVAACRRTNGLPERDQPPRLGERDGLSDTRWISVIRRPGNRYVRKQCSHCLEPACVSVCPVGALRKTEEGPVVYDKSLCMGCRYCMLACPFGIPRYEWSSTSPSVRKCVMCHENIVAGKLAEPACVSACPTGAAIYGSRRDMLAEAESRLSRNPEIYINRIWGAREVGGTSVILDLRRLPRLPRVAGRPHAR